MQFSKTFKTIISIAISSSLMYACDVAPEDGEDFNSDSYIADLAWRYSELEVDADGAESINEEVRALSPDDLREFTHRIQESEGANEFEREVTMRLTEIAIERGGLPMDLTEEDINTIVDDVGADLAVPRAWCKTWKPSSTTTLYGQSFSGGTTAVMSDRRSTGWLEFGGCDHRFYFNGTRNTIRGTSTKYNNWILDYSGVLGQHTGTGTYAVMGNGKALANYIFSVDYSKLKAK